MANSTVVESEIELFGSLAESWWDPHGPLRGLHNLNPQRIEHIVTACGCHFCTPTTGRTPLGGLRLLDIGCGGGLLSEPMAMLGAGVLGIDAAAPAIGAARHHAAMTGATLDYQVVDVEALAAGGHTFDVVLAMEVVEHVADVPRFLRNCAALTAPGGLLFVSTINRTPKAYVLTIVFAEYIAGLIPKGTHTYRKFVTPAEVTGQLPNWQIVETRGLSMSLMAPHLRPSRDTSVNYTVVAAKPVNP